jgi:hypothetical protein
MSGFSTVGHLFRTTNGGKVWKNISGNLPNAPINAFLIDSLAEDHDPLKKNQCIVVAMDVGVYLTTDGGKSWSKLGTAIPNLVVNTLTIYRNLLIAGTAGRSAWAFDISGVKASQLSVRPESSSASASELLSVRPNPLILKDGSALTITVRGESLREENIQLDLLNAETGALVNSSTYRLQASSGAQDITLAMPQNISSGSYLVRINTKNGMIGAAQISVVK